MQPTLPSRVSSPVSKQLPQPVTNCEFGRSSAQGACPGRPGRAGAFGPERPLLPGDDAGLASRNGSYRACARRCTIPSHKAQPPLPGLLQAAEAPSEPLGAIFQGPKYSFHEGIVVADTAAGRSIRRFSKKHRAPAQGRESISALPSLPLAVEEEELAVFELFEAFQDAEAVVGQ